MRLLLSLVFVEMQDEALWSAVVRCAKKRREGWQFPTSRRLPKEPTKLGNVELMGVKVRGDGLRRGLMRCRRLPTAIGLAG